VAWSALNVQPASPEPLPLPSAALAEPEPGALGRLVLNASLISEATWSPEASRVNRLLHFNFHVEARPITEAPGLINVTLTRAGKDVCTVSLNNKTSHMSSGVYWGDASCTDTLPTMANVTCTSRVQANGMMPIKVVLTEVQAVRK
jgi:hypothetical protein